MDKIFCNVNIHQIKKIGTLSMVIRHYLYIYNPPRIKILLWKNIFLVYYKGEFQIFVCNKWTLKSVELLCVLFSGLTLYH